MIEGSQWHGLREQVCAVVSCGDIHHANDPLRRQVSTEVIFEGDVSCLPRGAAAGDVANC